MTTIKITISNETLKEIKNTYEHNDSKTINIVVNDILNRYLNTEHFDPELIMNNDN